jgi:two-component system, LytTR family, response regulator
MIQQQTNPLSITKTRSLPYTDIIYIKADSNYSIIYNSSGTPFLTSKTLKHWQGLLSTDDFVRVNKSCLINVKAIKSVDRNKITLCNDAEVVASRRRGKMVKGHI